MRHHSIASTLLSLGLAALALGVAAPAPAGADPAGAADSLLAAARGLVRRGEYQAALGLLTPLFLDASTADRARRLALEAASLSGEHEQARHIASLVDAGDAPRLVAAAGEALLDLGEEEPARALLEAALEAHRRAPAVERAPLEVALGRLLAERGERAAGRAHYEAVPLPARRGLPGGADSAAAGAAAAAAATIFTMRAPTDSMVAEADRLVTTARAAWGRGEFQAAKNLLERASLVDPLHEAARLFAASLLIEKHETQLARGALRPILGANPRHPEALFLIARASFADGAYRPAEEASRAVLGVNPAHPGALGLLAALDLADEGLHAAAASLAEALQAAPGSRPLRSLNAGLLLQSGDSAGSEGEIAAILAEAPRYADAWFIVGGCLDRLRRYPEAAAYYQRALALDPEHAAAANALGLSAMRDGREEEAGKWLDRGLELDPYNIRTFNMRVLLKKLGGYHRLETAHFVMKIDEPDLALAPLLGPYLESVYAGECERFGFEPERKTSLELFGEPGLLSGRMIGLPDIEGIPGACFGPVIGMDSPRLWQGKTNWQTIVRHEFGHVLALTRTGKRVPFWFTEGLSVMLEGHPPTLDQDRLARWALDEGELLPFHELNHGFTRAKSPLHRSLAYYESAFAIRRLIERGGFDAVLAFLDGYAAGRSTGDMVGARLGMTEGAWAAEVDSMLRAHIAALPVWPLPSAARLRERVEESAKRPDDLDARLRMAREWLEAGELETAVSEALAVVEADSSRIEARLVLGHALLLEKEPLAAAVHLEKLVEAEPLPYLAVRDLGIVYAEVGEEEAAAAYLEEAIRLYPADPEPYRKLAELERRAGRLDRAAAALGAASEVGEAPYDDLLALADLARERGKPREEAAALERSLAVRPFERETVARLARLYREEDEASEAVRTYEVLCLLDRQDVEAHRALVELALEHGPADTARRFAERLAELDPESELARRALGARP